MIIRKPGSKERIDTKEFKPPLSASKVPKSSKKSKGNEEYPSVEICCFSYRYPRRTWWQLTSIAEQIPAKGIPVPKIKVTLNLHRDDPGLRTYNKLVKTFRKRIDLNVRWWDTEDAHRRAVTRNKDIAEATEDFLLFVDADQVWHPEFFATLAPFLKKYDEENEGRCIAHWRYTMGIEEGNQLVDAEEYIKRPIGNWFHKVKSVPLKKISGPRGAGGFQLVNRRLLEERGIDSYALPKRDRPANKANWYQTKAEMAFRKKIGGVFAEDCKFFKPFYHLNHFRKDSRVEAMENDYLF